MEHVFDWFRRQRELERPWLILGKGPSFALRDRYDLGAYHLLSLNHAVREQPVLLAHMIDLDVVDACGEGLLGQAAYVVLPWYPHVKNAPGTRSLDELRASHPLLRRLASEGRLLWYDLSTAPRRHGPGPVVQATYFSAEAAVSLLALAGVRRVRSLGVDGGAGYSMDFEDLTRRTLLANGHPEFDLQFRGIARTILRTAVDFAPLDHPSPIVACIASDESSALPDRVLEFSVRQHTSMSVRVQRVGAKDELQAMPSGGAGPNGLVRAIVLRSGALVLDDLRKLWTIPWVREALEVPADGPGATTRVRPAVSVATAAEMHRLGCLARAAMEYAPLTADSTHHGAGVTTYASLPASWNRQDRFEEGATSLLLYATPELRPWVSRAHPYGHLWVAALLEAVQAGFVTRELIRDEVRRGYVRPSLLDQVEQGTAESLLLPRSAWRRDAGFTPPGGPPAAPAGLLTHPLVVLRALARQARRRASAYRRRRADSAVAPRP